MKFKEMCWVKVAQGHWEGTPMSSYAQNKMYLCMKLERTAFESGFCLFSVWIPAQVVKFDGKPVYLLNYLIYPQIGS